MGIGHAPLSNLYESLVFFAWTAGVIYLFVELKYKNALIGAFVTPIAFLAMAYASMSPNISDRSPTPGAGPEKQLAYRSCGCLLFWLCCICRRIRDEYHVFDQGE